MKLVTALLAVGAGLLAGCATPEDRARWAQQSAWEAQQRAAQYRARLLDQCRAYGFVEGTTIFSQCLMQVDQANQAQNAQMRAVLLQQIMQQQQQQYLSKPRCSDVPIPMRTLGSCR